MIRKMKLIVAGRKKFLIYFLPLTLITIIIVLRIFLGVVVIRMGMDKNNKISYFLGIKIRIRINYFIIQTDALVGI